MGKRVAVGKNSKPPERSCLSVYNIADPKAGSQRGKRLKWATLRINLLIVCSASKLQTVLLSCSAWAAGVGFARLRAPEGRRAARRNTAWSASTVRLFMVKHGTLGRRVKAIANQYGP